MYVFVSICVADFPLDDGFRSGIIVGGMTAPADGILYHIHISSEMNKSDIFDNFLLQISYQCIKYSFESVLKLIT